MKRRTPYPPPGLPCPAKCGRKRYPSHILCVRCWKDLPSDLQREVHQTWREVQVSSAPAAFLDYQIARDAALDWLSRPRHTGRPESADSVSRRD